ncbi:MAG: ABC transporter ATP-binding protein [Woeseiaceae bacterium]
MPGSERNRPKPRILTPIWRLRHLARPYRVRMIVGVVAFGVARFFEAMVPFLTAVSINRLWEGNYDLTGPVAGIAGAVVLRYGVVTFARYNVRRVGFYVAFDLRQRLYDALQHQGQRFFANHTVGDMMTRAIADIALIQRLFAMGTILFVIVVYATLFGFAFMLYLSPILTLALLPPLPFVFWYTLHAAKQMELASTAVQNRLSDIGAHVQENLTGIRTIQAMVQEEREIARFEDTNQRYADAFYEQGRVNSSMVLWMTSLAAICTLIIIGYGGNQVLTGAMPVGNFVAFFMYVNMVVKPFGVAGFIINLFQRAAVASNRLYEIFDLEPEIPDAQKHGTPEHIAGHVSIRNLSYSYPGTEQKILDDVSFEIDQGETVAIMGRIGAGKTTLLKQIVRLIDPSPGSILIDGHDVADYSLSQLRAQVAMVPQDPFLFGEPLKDNLTYDDPNRALDKIWDAVNSADLKTTIEEFPDQLLTLVGERGVTLSGGQKQRATLARGLIRHAPILILDDCFSAVDTETEEHILSELKRLRANQTTLLVSHRVSTARRADRIIVLEAGRIMEIGSHRELIDAGGYYAELERVQREGAEEEDLARVRSNT